MIKNASLIEICRSCDLCFADHTFALHGFKLTHDTRLTACYSTYAVIDMKLVLNGLECEDDASFFITIKKMCNVQLS